MNCYKFQTAKLECPQGDFMNGYRMKILGEQVSGVDDIAAYGISMKCKDSESEFTGELSGPIDGKS